MELLKKIYNFFPFQLVILQVKHHLVLLLFWLYIVALISGNIGSTYGMSNLFLNPEYMGKVNFWSFLFLGIGFGTFFMAWNTSTYILSSFRFPFLATLDRPMSKFVLNNTIIPLVFVIYICVQISLFQYNNEFRGELSIFWSIFAFLFGIGLMILFNALYFALTNKSLANAKISKKIDELAAKRNKSVEKIIAQEKPWSISFYLSGKLRLRRVRHIKHYSYEQIAKVFDQNHLNTVVFQFFCLMILLGIGKLIENPVFRIPAGASFFMLLTVLITIISGLTFWMKNWVLLGISGLIILLNISLWNGWLPSENRAYGLNYDETTTYSLDNLNTQSSRENFQRDVDSMELILNNWKEKVQKDGKKPPILFINSSGGGLRSSVWSMQVVQTLDSLTNGAFFDHTFLITGASGGMLGMAYLRELYLQQSDSINPLNPKYVEKISQDVLNPIAFSVITSDLFYANGTFKYNNQEYVKDRGYMMEKVFNENTDFILDKPLKAYYDPEFNAKIPLMILSPFIGNGGRKLLISPHKMTFLTRTIMGNEVNYQEEVTSIDLMTYFHKNKPENLLFTSALRMNATFPYILPPVQMPTTPKMEIFDAGIPDNFGVETSAKFIKVFKNWIKENTSKVIFIQIRDTEKIDPVVGYENGNIQYHLFNPFNAIYANWAYNQDYNQDNEISDLYELLDKKIEVVRFCYGARNDKEMAGVSFHLTKREKIHIKNALYNEENQESIKKTLRLFKGL